MLPVGPRSKNELIIPSKIKRKLMKNFQFLIKWIVLLCLMKVRKWRVKEMKKKETNSSDESTTL